MYMHIFSRKLFCEIPSGNLLETEVKKAEEFIHYIYDTYSIQKSSSISQAYILMQCYCF